MSSLADIVYQIGITKASIYTYKQSISINEEKLARLKSAYKQLKIHEQEFKRLNTELSRFSLSKADWNGSFARKFNDQILVNKAKAFKRISTVEFNNIMQQLSDEISRISTSIRNLENNVAAKNNALSRLEKRRKDCLKENVN